MRTFVRKAMIPLLVFTMLMQGMQLPAKVYANEGTENKGRITGIEQSGNADIPRKMELYYQLKADPEDVFQSVNSSTVLNTDDIGKFKAQYEFEILDHEMNGKPNRSVHAGDYVTLDLPKELTILNGEETGEIFEESDGAKIADYAFIKGVDHWQVVITFAALVDDVSVYRIKGQLSFDFGLDLTQIETGKDTTITIPLGNGTSTNLKIHRPTPPPTTPTALQKSVEGYDEKTRTLTWKVELTPTTGIFEGYTFYDTLDPTTMELLSIEHGKDKLTADAYTYDTNTGEVNYTIASGRNGKNYTTILIKVKVKDSLYVSHGSVTLKNKAFLKDERSGGTLQLSSNEASHVIKPQWLKKEGSVYAGNKIQWKITVNSSKQSMYDAVVKDQLQQEVMLDPDHPELAELKVDNNLIPLYVGSHTPSDDQEVYGLLDGTTLFIYFARTPAHASNAEHTITFVSEIKKVDHDITQNYQNEASLTAKLLGDDGIGKTIDPTIDTSGVGVPSVYIAKQAKSLSQENKQDGTIDWKIDVASNLSAYGKSEIVDTIPNDQTFVNATWNGILLDNDNRKDVYYEQNGNEIKIVFQQKNALAIEQELIVKTKILPSIYGTNLDKMPFTNHAIVSIYDELDLHQIARNQTDASVDITNHILTKKAVPYEENDTQAAQYPRIRYDIKINENQMPLEHVSLDDDFKHLITKFAQEDDNYQKIDGVTWKLLEDSLSIKKVAGSNDSFDEDAWTYLYQNDQLKIDFNQSIHDQYVVSYVLELDPSQSEVFKENGKLQMSGNAATLHADSLKDTQLTTTATNENQVIPHIMLAKSGTQSDINIKEQQVTWTIQVNQHKMPLISNIIEDILPKGLSLDPTSLVLYTNVIDEAGNFKNDFSQATEITNPKYSYEILKDGDQAGSHRLRVELPNQDKDYVLQFTTDIDKQLLGQAITNSAYYANQGDKPLNNSSSHIQISSKPGGSSNRKATLEIQKQDSETLAPLADATFALYWMDNGRETWMRDLTTDASGSVFAYGLTIGETYKVVEKKAPDGYAVSDRAGQILKVESTTLTPMVFQNAPIKKGTWTPKAYKSLNQALTETFAFTIKDEQGKVVLNGENETSTNKTKMPVQFSLANQVSEEQLLTYQDAHNFVNGETRYLVAQRTVTFAEVAPTLPGYEHYDKSTHTYTIRVTNVLGKKDLEVDILDENGIDVSDHKGNFAQDSQIPEFRNIYSTNGTLVVQGHKELQGRKLANEQFLYTLTECDASGNPLLNGLTLTTRNTKSGDILFDPIAYTNDDIGRTFYYKVREIDDGQLGYTYDTSIYDVQVKVLDQGDGTITLDKQMMKDNVAISDITFHNTYVTNQTEYQIQGQKTLKGKPLSANQFQFILLDQNGIIVDETSNDSDGNFAFRSLQFRQSDIGTHTYRVMEKPGSQPGILYDQRIFTCVIEVIDQGDGTLRTQATFKTDKVESRIQFENEYHTNTVTMSFPFRVNLSGQSLRYGAFRYRLREVDVSGNPLKDIGVYAVRKDGRLDIPDVTYTYADAGKKFYYTLQVEDEQKPGYTYDHSIYVITIEIVDHDNGYLEIIQSITQNGEIISEPTFDNAYQNPTQEDQIQDGNGSDSDEADGVVSGDSTQANLYILCLFASFLVAVKIRKKINQKTR